MEHGYTPLHQVVGLKAVSEPRTKHSEPVQLREALKTTDTFDAGHTALDAELHGETALQAAGNSPVATRTSHETAGGRFIVSGEPAHLPLPVTDYLDAAATESAQQGSSNEATIVPDILAATLPSESSNVHDHMMSVDSAEQKLSDEDQGGRETMALHTAHDAVGRFVAGSATVDMGGPSVVQSTTIMGQLHQRTSHGEQNLQLGDPMDLGEDVANQMDNALSQNIQQDSVSQSNFGEAIAVQPSITADHLDIDSNGSDVDSAIGVGLEPSTISIRSSIYDMVEENGRTYHRYKEGKYVLPNDELEQIRLDLQHHLFVMTLSGALHLAPLSAGVQDVLDLATGTGIWAIEFATKYPSASVVGVDLSPIQPLYVPSNCSFEVDDADDPWLFSQKFDYIHGRLLLACFPNFANIARQAFEFTKPGGYFELQDLLIFDCYDDSWEGSDLQRLMRLLFEGAAKMGMDYNKASKYKNYLADAGFEDIHEIHFAWPSNGRWPKGEHYKNLGRWNLQNMLDGIGGISMGVLTRVHGWTKEQVDALIVGVKRDLADRSIHAYLPVRVVYGRKPVLG